jgi:hypothetical protein
MVHIVRGDSEYLMHVLSYNVRTGVCNQYDIQCLERLALAGKEGSRLQLPLMYRNTTLELNLGFGHERIYRILKK